MDVVERDGVGLSFEEVGSGEPPMVFVHGWTCEHSALAPQVEHFKRTHRTVAVDLRGHGASDAPEGDYSISLLADDVVWVGRQLALGPSVIVGHSMGAVVALDLAARHPEAVAALVLVDSAPVDPPPETTELLGQFVEELRGEGSIAARRRFVEGLLFLPSDDAALKARVCNEMLAVPGHVAYGCMKALTEWPGTDLRTVGVPVLAIHADRPLNDPAKLSGLCPTLINAQTPGVGHFNQLLAPDLVNQLIEGFLVERLDPSS